MTDATGAHIHNGKAGQNGDSNSYLLKIPIHLEGCILTGNVIDSSLQGPMEGKYIRRFKTAMGNGDTYVNCTHCRSSRWND